MTSENVVTVERLTKIFEYYRQPGMGVAATYRIIATKLCQKLAPQPTWTWQYLHQISRGKLIPSAKIRASIADLFWRLQCEKKVELEIVRVNAPRGTVIPNSIVTIGTRWCQYVACRNAFIPRNYNQKYCSISCRNNERNKRRRYRINEIDNP